MDHNSPAKALLLILFLLELAGMGIAHVISPDTFMKSSGFGQGGEMLTAWNRLNVRLTGAVCAGRRYIPSTSSRSDRPQNTQRAIFVDGASQDARMLGPGNRTSARHRRESTTD